MKECCLVISLWLILKLKWGRTPSTTHHAEGWGYPCGITLRTCQEHTEIIILTDHGYFLPQSQWPHLLGTHCGQSESASVTWGYIRSPRATSTGKAVICPHNRNFGKVGRQGPCLYRHSPRRSSVGECCAPRTGRTDCTFPPGAQATACSEPGTGVPYVLTDLAMRLRISLPGGSCSAVRAGGQNEEVNL